MYFKIAGTLGPNLGELVTQFKNGVEYSCKKIEGVNDYGTIESTIGRVSIKLLYLKLI